MTAVVASLPPVRIDSQALDRLSRLSLELRPRGVSCGSRWCGRFPGMAGLTGALPAAPGSADQQPERIRGSFPGLKSPSKLMVGGEWVAESVAQAPWVPPPSRRVPRTSWLLKPLTPAGRKLGVSHREPLLPEPLETPLLASSTLQLKKGCSSSPPGL